MIKQPIGWSSPAPSTGLLRGTAQAIDGAFLKAGRRLGDSSRLAATIKATVAGLPACLNTDAIEAAELTLSAFCDRLRRAARRLTNEADIIRAIATSIEDTATPLARLNRSVKTLGILAVSARVTSAAIVSGKTDIAGFNRELADRVLDTSQNVSAFNQTIVSLRSSAGIILDLVQEDHVLLALAGRIEDRLKDFRVERARAAEWSASLDAPINQALSEVSAGVVALQVGDSVRQRLEHAAAIQASAAEGHSWPKGGPEENAISTGSHVLLAALVKDAAEDLDAGLNDIAAAMKQIENSCNRVAERGRSRVSNSALSLLTGEVEQAVATLGAFGERQENVVRVARAIVQAVTDLSTTSSAIAAIESDMRLVSLNASIKCAQLGQEGHALRVIAEQLDVVTAETATAALAVVHSFKEAHAQTEAYSQSQDIDSQRALLEIGSSARSAINVLQQVNADMLSAAELLDTTVATISAHVFYAESAFIGLRDGAESLLDLAQEFEEAAVVPWTGALEQQTCAPLDAWRALYTMQSERLIHDAIFGSGPNSSRAPAGAATGDPELQVEMF